MTATVALCILSTITFCLCTRGVLTLTSLPNTLEGRAWYASDSLNEKKISMRAKRIARGYAVFALSVLAAMALVGAGFSYVELFSTL